MDASAVGFTINNASPDYSSLQTILNEMEEWMRCNKEALNHKKTVIMHLNTSTSATPPPVVTMGGNPFQVVEATKHLGVTTDTWKEHVNRLVRSAFYLLYLLRGLKTMLTPAHELPNV